MMKAETASEMKISLAQTCHTRSDETGVGIGMLSVLLRSSRSAYSVRPLKIAGHFSIIRRKTCASGPYKSGRFRRLK